MTPMMCPECGVEMNHHADKLVFMNVEAGSTDLEESIEEFHSCPECGRTQSRLSAQ